MAGVVSSLGGALLIDTSATGALALVVVALLVATLLVAAAGFLDAGLLAALIMSSRPASFPVSDIVHARVSNLHAARH